MHVLGIDIGGSAIKGAPVDIRTGRLNKYLCALDGLFWPDLFIIGGGVSAKHRKWLPLLKLRTKIVPAGLLNDAGIVGAALAAAQAKD